MKEKFTPGPWIVDFDLCDEEGQLDVPEVNGRILDQDNCVVCQASTEPNVFLIHAAPDMYAALDAILHRIQKGGRVDEWTLQAFAKNAAAALKKARGES